MSRRGKAGQVGQAERRGGMRGAAQAAAAIEALAPNMRARVFRYLAERGGAGATCDEVERALGVPHQTVSARVNELMTRGRIVDSTRRRPTCHGRAAIVWVIGMPLEDLPVGRGGTDADEDR